MSAPPEPAPPRLRSGGLVWITRTAPAAEITAERVRALGFQAFVRPLLQVRPVEAGPLDLVGVGAVAFTSVNAVAAFCERSQVRELRVFVVGDATARAAAQAGFETVLSAQGDVATLATALTARRREIAGAVFYPSAAEPAQDLAGALRRAGFEVRQAPLYETVETTPAPALIARLPDVDAVLLHSAKAAHALARLLGAHPAPQLVALCLSAQVAAPLLAAALAGRLAAAASAPEPHEASLLALLAQSAGG